MNLLNSGTSCGEFSKVSVESLILLTANLETNSSRAKKDQQEQCTGRGLTETYLLDVEEASRFQFGPWIGLETWRAT